jgi:serine/threonine protein kinase
MAALTAISDPCVPALIEDLETTSVLVYVVESRTGMSLKMGVEAHGSLPDDAVKAIVTQLFSAVAAIFMAGYAHLRICSETIFIDNEGRLTINDFRYAYEYSKEKSDDLYAAVSDKCGEDIYVAPEVYKSIKYNARKAVIWSCGVVVVSLDIRQQDFSPDRHSTI